MRKGNPPLPARTTGWILGTAAAWLGVSAAGAWFPLWPVLLLAVVGAFVDARAKSRQLWIAGDVVVVALAGLLSIPPLAPGALMGTVVAVAGAGFVVDSLVGRFLTPVRITSVVLLLLVAGGASGMVMIYRPPAHFRYFGKMLLYTGLTPALHIGLAAACTGDRVVLETGAVAWLEQPSGEGPFPGALLFHGAHPDGSRQASDCILRRALLDAGFVVLSVDHPGYGESPTPKLDGDIDAWDPLPTMISALKTLRSIPDVDRIVAVGHSLGAQDVLRLLSVESKLANTVIFGAGLSDPKEKDEYWYGRFHRDRHMPMRISRDKFLEIRERFYDNGHIVQNLPSNHPAIVFVRFGFEHSNIEATRDKLYEAISGAKTVWNLPDSTHYFSSFKVAGIVVANTQVTRLLASRFRLLADELPLLGQAS